MGVDRLGNVHDTANGRFDGRANARPAGLARAEAESAAHVGGMMHARSRRAARAALAAAAIVTTGMLLAGCVTPGDSPSGPGPRPTSSVTAAPQPTPGQTLSPSEVDGAKDAGLDTYTFGDGTTIAVDPGAPLPAAVIDDLALGATQYAINGTNGSGGTKAIADVGRTMGERNWVLVSPAWGALEPGGTEQWNWFVAANGEVIAAVDVAGDQTNAVSIAESYIAGQPDPASWELVIAPPAG